MWSPSTPWTLVVLFLSLSAGVFAAPLSDETAGGSSSGGEHISLPHIPEINSIHESLALQALGMAKPANGSDGVSAADPSLSSREPASSAARVRRVTSPPFSESSKVMRRRREKRSPLMMGMPDMGSMMNMMPSTGGAGSGGAGLAGMLPGIGGGGGVGGLAGMPALSGGSGAGGIANMIPGLGGMMGSSAGGNGGLPDMPGGSGGSGSTPTISSSPPVGCPPLQLIFARGTTEVQGTLGVVGRPLCTSLQSAIPGTLCYDVVYTSDAEYMVSPTQGAQTASGFMRELTSRCPSTKFALGGYSKGAFVVHRIKGSNVVGAVTFGVMEKGQAVPTTPNFKTFCAQGDPVCLSGANMMAHLTYPMTSIQPAVQFLVQAYQSSRDSAGVSDTTNIAPASSPGSLNGINGLGSLSGLGGLGGLGGGKSSADGLSSSGSTKRTPTQLAPVRRHYRRYRKHPGSLH